MDAWDFTKEAGGVPVQYSLPWCRREVVKAWAAFSAPDRPPDQKQREDVRFGIASGNWGCGVFGGDKLLKALLQAVAATLADRPLLEYYP